MMNSNNKKNQFCGIFKIAEPKHIYNSPIPYYHFILQDESESINAITWDNRLKGISVLEDGLVVEISGLLMTNDYGDYVQCFDIKGASEESLPAAETGNDELLTIIINGFDDKMVRDFLKRIFNNHELRRRFITYPASREHHHSYAGGLLEHSIDVMKRLAASIKSDVDKDALEVAKAAALLHDIGKTIAFNGDGSKTDYGQITKHENYNIEILSPALTAFDNRWHDGALAIRSLIYPHTYHDNLPRFEPAATCLQAADQASSAISVQSKSSSDKCSVTRVAVAGPKREYWQPKKTRRYKLAI